MIPAGGLFSRMPSLCWMELLHEDAREPALIGPMPVEGAY